MLPLDLPSTGGPSGLNKKKLDSNLEPHEEIKIPGKGKSVCNYKS